MKQRVLIIVLVVVAAALAWFLTTDVPASAPEAFDAQSESGPVPFTLLEEGEYAAAVTEETNYRVTSQEDLELLWTMIYGEEAPSMPTVDFATHEVLAVFSGMQSSGGYSISVKEIVNRGGTRIVTILHTQPGEECSVTDALTSPYEIVTIPAGTETLTHEDEVVEVSCS